MGFRRKTRGLLRYLYITIQYDTQKAAISAPYNVPLALQSLSQPLSTNNLETSSCEWSCSASSPIRQENLSGNISFLDKPKQMCNLDERSTDNSFRDKCYGATLALQNLANWTFRSRDFFWFTFRCFHDLSANLIDTKEIRHITIAREW